MRGSRCKACTMDRGPHSLPNNSQQLCRQSATARCGGGRSFAHPGGGLAMTDNTPPSGMLCCSARGTLEGRTGGFAAGTTTSSISAPACVRVGKWSSKPQPIPTKLPQQLNTSLPYGSVSPSCLQMTCDLT